MRVWIAVHLAQLPVEAFFRANSIDLGCVVVDTDRAIAVSPAAQLQGVRPGMRRGGISIMAPEVHVFDRDLVRENDALRAVATALLQYTPLVAMAEHDTIVMDVGASLLLFGGARVLYRRILHDVHALGFTSSIAMAPTALGAWVLSRNGTGIRRIVKMASLVRRLDEMPLPLLPPARAFLIWFDGIGCRSLAELRRLPRPGLQRRCGRSLLDFLDAAYGLVPEFYEWMELPQNFRAQVEIFGRVERTEELLVGAHGLILQMLGWLCVGQLAVRRIVLSLIHERGRVACPPTEVEIALAEPIWEDHHLMRLLRERLARETLASPVIGLALEAVDVVARAPRSDSLFPDAAATEVDHKRMVELLMARLGAENVLHAAPRADHRPEVANAWSPVSADIADAKRVKGAPADLVPLSRPTWLLAKPIRLLIRNHRPFYSSPLKLVAGPERIEAGWWSEAQSRDYFIAEGSEHALYWIYRERTVDDAGEPEAQWYLHGLFG
jgi:protein ImuB